MFFKKFFDTFFICIGNNDLIIQDKPSYLKK